MAEKLLLIRRCVVISISKASDRTSVIYALKLNNDGSIEGHPFQLYQPNGIEYIWQNSTITKENISSRSTLKCYSFGDIVIYRGNTKKEKISVDGLQIQLDYNENVFKSIKEACPGVVFCSQKGAYLAKKPKNPCIFLVSLKKGYIKNERLTFWTKEDEEAINLQLKCREHFTLSSKPIRLQIREVQGEEDVGDTALIRFGNEATDCMREPTYSAVCEGLILKFKPKVISIDDEPVKIKNGEGNVILVPGSVKFDTGNDVATAISHRLLEELGLEPDQSKKIRVTGVGGDMECFRVEIALRIRRRAFKVSALVGAVAGDTDLLIGKDIITELDKLNFSFGQ